MSLRLLYEPTPLRCELWDTVGHDDLARLVQMVDGAPKVLPSTHQSLGSFSLTDQELARFSFLHFAGVPFP